MTIDFKSNPVSKVGYNYINVSATFQDALGVNTHSPYYMAFNGITFPFDTIFQTSTKVLLSGSIPSSIGEGTLSVSGYDLVGSFLTSSDSGYKFVPAIIFGDPVPSNISKNTIIVPISAIGPFTTDVNNYYCKLAETRMPITTPTSGSIVIESTTFSIFRFSATISATSDTRGTLTISAAFGQPTTPVSIFANPLILTEMLNTANIVTASTSISGMFTDPRDGKLYFVKTIGPIVTYCTDSDFASPTGVDNGYGKTYTYADAVSSAPLGWHLPTSAEWNSLITCASNIPRYLKTKPGEGIIAWPVIDGTNLLGFSAQPFGYYDTMVGGIDSGTAFYNWTSGTSGANARYFKITDFAITNNGLLPTSSASLKVRYMKDNDGYALDKYLITSSSTVTSAFTDPRDLKVYQVGNIGSTIVYCVDSDFASPTGVDNGYGKMYTYADAVSSAPPGWHLPTSAEWNSLIQVTYGIPRYLKTKPSEGSASWTVISGANTFKFSAQPLGYYDTFAGGQDIGTTFYNWTSGTNGISAYYFTINDYTMSTTKLLPTSAATLKVRYMKNNDGYPLDKYLISSATSIPTSSYTDPRDGSIYNTSTINGLIWMDTYFKYPLPGSIDSGYGCIQYTYADALSGKPVGWHLPTQDEWNSLITCANNIPRYLKTKPGESIIPGDWYNIHGSNTFKFSAMPTGYYDPGIGQVDYGALAYCWTSNTTGTSAYHFKMDDYTMSTTNKLLKTMLLPVRYVHD